VALSDKKIVARNRKAWHDYSVHKSIETGLVLLGTEIKSIRAGRVSLKGSYAAFDDNAELWVHHMHIAEYDKARENHDPYRRRKLLAHTAQLRRLQRDVMEKGFTLIPLDIHLAGGRAKLELGLCKGKRQYDKRRAIAEKDAKRAAEVQLRNRNKSDEY